MTKQDVVPRLAKRVRDGRGGRDKIIRLWCCVLLLCLTRTLAAEPFAHPGDIQLRHDLEYLADRGLLGVPLTTWPVSWADIAAAVASIDPAVSLPLSVQNIVERLERKIAHETHWGVPRSYLEFSFSSDPTTLRTFHSVPRGTAEVTGSLEYLGRALAGKIDLTLIDPVGNDNHVRWDGSYLAYLFGNTAVSLGVQPQWWGPGHAGSLILSNNARPVPGLMVKRNMAIPFNNRWLRWIGPWTGQLFIGQLDDDRFVSNAYLLGARVAFKPLSSLEIGISRTAQWGGSGRPKGLSSLVNLIIGRDNRGEGVSREEEPGNQLAGFDGKFSFFVAGLPMVLYGQVIGEDEAGGFPSRYMGQFGASTSLPLKRYHSSVRFNLEYSDTTCQFYENSRLFNCAYNHPIYRSGYRYRGRSLGHSSDNDAKQLALVASVNGARMTSWSIIAKGGTLNRGGDADDRNTVTSIAADFFEFEAMHTRPFYGGHIDIGVGYRELDNNLSMSSENEFEFFVKWSTREF